MWSECNKSFYQRRHLLEATSKWNEPSVVCIILLLTILSQMIETEFRLLSWKPIAPRVTSNFVKKIHWDHAPGELEESKYVILADIQDINYVIIALA